MNLKQLFRIFILLCVATPVVQAQDFDKTLSKLDLNQREQKEFKLFHRAAKDSSGTKLTYGLQFGANVSDLLGDANGTSSQIGYMIGGFAEYDIKPDLIFHVGLNYSREGARQDGSELQTGVSLDSGLTAASRYNYLSVPINLRYYILEDYGFFVTGGPTLGYLLGAQLQGTGGEFSLTSDDRIDVADRLNKLDLGLNVGIGVTWAKMLDFTIRYKRSFTNTIDHTHERTASSGTFANKSIQVIFGFRL